MKHKVWLILAILTGIFPAATVLAAHHGTASFDRSKVTVLKGTVTNFIWTNPHGEIEFAVRDGKGHAENWQGSLTSPNWLARAGWTKDTLKPGEMITISGNVSKNRANTLWITRIQLADGQQLPVDGIENIQ